MNQNTTGKQGSRMLRRRFLRETTAVAAAFNFITRQVLGGKGQVAPSGKTTLAFIGMGGQGLINLKTFLEFVEVQVTAVCDVHREGEGFLSWSWGEGKEQHRAGREPGRQLVEEHYARQKTSGIYRGCRTYSDYRELLAKEDVDAVVISTPDHTHAVIAMAALRRRKHVYCEKPLTYSVYEARQVAEEARRAKVATQLGNFGQASEESRLVCEYIWDGSIGPVREINAFCIPRFWPAALWSGRPPETPPVPEGLDWDLWLGPALKRPYHPAYHPWTWRNWWDFGTGLLGDLGCHMLSPAFKALKLGHPTTVEASSTRTDAEIYPAGVIARYEFPARGDLPPLALNWYDGGLKPPTPKDLEQDRTLGGNTLMYVGEKGVLLGHRLIPESRQRRYGKPPQLLARSPGHYKEWVDACRGGPPAGANFVDHAGLLTETCLLGNVALRSGEKITWDGPNLKVTNNEESNRFLHREYRQGWSL